MVVVVVVVVGGGGGAVVVLELVRGRRSGSTSAPSRRRGTRRGSASSGRSCTSSSGPRSTSVLSTVIGPLAFVTFAVVVVAEVVVPGRRSGRRPRRGRRSHSRSSRGRRRCRPVMLGEPAPTVQVDGAVTVVDGDELRADPGHLAGDAAGDELVVGLLRVAAIRACPRSRRARGSSRRSSRGRRSRSSTVRGREAGRSQVRWAWCLLPTVIEVGVSDVILADGGRVRLLDRGEGACREESEQGEGDEEESAHTRTCRPLRGMG